MADYQFYPLGITAENAKKAIDTAAQLYATPGMVWSNGRGLIRTAEPGNDYGYPVIYGNGEPTVFTTGEVGQFYYNLVAASAPYVYVCVDYTQQGYQWEAVGGSGSGFRILGYYQTLEQMQSSVTRPSAGDAYGVGTDAPYTIFVFDGISHTWKNNGTLGVGGVPNGIPPHGATGQALVKASNASGDVEWGDINTDIPDGSITGDKLSPKAVTEEKYEDASIPTRAYKDASVTRAKLAQDALYSPAVIRGTSNFTASDIGCTLQNSWGQSATYTLTQAFSATLPMGATIAVLRFGGATTFSVKIVGSGVRFAIPGDTMRSNATLEIQGFMEMVALKKVSPDSTNGDLWVAIGSVEVVA